MRFRFGWWRLRGTAAQQTGNLQSSWKRYLLSLYQLCLTGLKRLHCLRGADGAPDMQPGRLLLQSACTPLQPLWGGSSDTGVVVEKGPGGRGYSAAAFPTAQPQHGYGRSMLPYQYLKHIEDSYTTQNRQVPPVTQSLPPSHSKGVNRLTWHPRPRQSALPAFPSLNRTSSSNDKLR